MERLCLFVVDILSTNIDDSLNNFGVPEDVLKIFKISYANFEKKISKLRLKKLFHLSIEDKENKELEKQKLISNLRNALSTKEFFRLYGKLTEKQLENTSGNANSIAQIVEKIKEAELDLENDITGSIPTRDSEEDLYIFSEKEKKDAEKFYKKVKKLVDGYIKNKQGKSKKIVYDQKFIENLDPISKDIEKIIFMSNYYVGAKGSTKIRKAANKIKDYIEKHNYALKPTEDISKDLIIDAPMDIFPKNTITPITYLEILRKILKITKQKYEETRTELKTLKNGVKRDTVNNSISLRDKVRTIRKFIRILEDFMPMLEKFMAENPNFSKILKIKAKELMNLHENYAKIWSFLNSYEEITYRAKYGVNEEKLRSSNKDLDVYSKNISDLVITATKAKSIKKVSDCIKILNEDYKNCCELSEKFKSSEFAMTKDADIKQKDILQFEERLNGLEMNMSKQVDSLQNKMEELKKFLKNYKKENSKLNKTIKGIMPILSVLGALCGISSAISGIIKNIASL